MRDIETILDLFERYFNATMCGDWDKALWETDEFDRLVEEVEEVLGHEVGVKDQ